MNMFRQKMLRVRKPLASLLILTFLLAGGLAFADTQSNSRPPVSTTADAKKPQGFVASLNVNKATARAKKIGVGRAAYKGAASLLGLGLLLHIGVVWVKKTALGNNSSTYLEPFIKAALLMFFIANYAFWMKNVAEYIASWGSVSGAEANILVARSKAFSMHFVKKLSEEAEWYEVVASKLIDSTMHVICWLSYFVAGTIVQSLRLVQRVGLDFCIAIGPLVIGASMLPGPTSKWFESWILTYIELMLWGVAARIMSNLFISSYGSYKVDLNQLPSLANHLSFNFLYTFCFMSIPLMVTTIVRGRSPAAAAAGGVTTGLVGVAASGLANAWQNRQSDSGSSESGGGGSSTTPSSPFTPQGRIGD